jgi:hypothetical protein
MPLHTNPFRGKSNPFAHPNAILVDVPPAPETHVPRQPMRPYLTRPSGGLEGLLDGLGGAGRRPGRLEVERVRYHTPDAEDAASEAAEASQPASRGGDAPPTSWGRR